MQTTRSINIQTIKRDRNNPGYSGYRPQANFPRAKTREGIFTKLNNFINKLSTLQFSILVILIVLMSIFTYDKLSILTREGVSGVFGTDGGSNCDDLLNPKCWTDNFFPKLDETDQLTNALLIGLDTRDDDKGLLNTDTIMLASFDHRTGKTILISFPRDLYVPYYINNNGPYKTKINSIYAIGESDGLNGMDVLKSNVERWFGIKIHYTAKVYFDTVIDLVNSVGGVDITLTNNYTDVYPKSELPQKLQDSCKIPNDPQYAHYCQFTFEKGENHFDGQMALIYARMRSYTSDYDRSRRQQEIINALKLKGVSREGNLIDKAKFGWQIYQSLLDEKKVDSNIEYNDLLGGLFLLDKVDMNPINVVLNPSFGNGKFFVEDMIPMPGYENATPAPISAPEGGEAEEGGSETGSETISNVQNDGIPRWSVLLPIGGDFTQVKKEIEKIRKFPDIFREKALVTIVNGLAKTISVPEELKALESDTPFFGGKYNENIEPRFEDIKYKIYLFNDKGKMTANYIADKLGKDNCKIVNETELNGETQTKHKEDVKVVVSNVHVKID